MSRVVRIMFVRFSAMAILLVGIVSFVIGYLIDDIIHPIRTVTVVKTETQTLEIPVSTQNPCTYLPDPVIIPGPTKYVLIDKRHYNYNIADELNAAELIGLEDKLR